MVTINTIGWNRFRSKGARRRLGAEEPPSAREGPGDPGLPPLPRYARDPSRIRVRCAA